MASSDNDKELNGLARSIDALFSDGDKDEAEPVRSEAEPEVSPDEVVDGAVDEPEDAPAADVEATDAEPTADVEPTDAVKAPSGEEMVWEEVKEVRAPVGPADPEALAEAIDLFLKSDPLDRVGQGRTLREAAVAHRESNALEPLAIAVERLALEGGDPPDEACIVMAQKLVSAGAASRVVAKLGAARDEKRRAELMLVCKRVGHEMALAVADALSDTTDRFARRTFLECMVFMGQAGMAVVEEMAEDSRWFVVRNALAILGEVGGERAVERITATLAHSDPRVRREALLALAKVGLEDPDPDVRLAAAMAAGALKVERALRPLLAILENEDDPDVIVGILRALGQLGDPGAVQLIEKRAVGSFFSRPPADVRIAAYRALQNIGTPHAMSLLEAAVDDKDPEVRGAVRQLKGQS
jgi:hypothetical protein